MKSHFCKAEGTTLSYEDECNWCGEKEMTLDLNKQQLMVDPPSGWMFGFPALWDKTVHPKLEDLLRDKKYPEKDIEFACQYCRMWNAEEK